MVIPPNSLSAEALQGVLEEFISRDGTDYGGYEWSLEDKVNHLKPQVLRGDVLIVFDAVLESVTLVTKQEYQAQKHE